MKKSKKKSDAENHLADLPPPMAVGLKCKLHGDGAPFFSQNHLGSVPRTTGDGAQVNL
jgi:hypothetical protein